MTAHHPAEARAVALAGKLRGLASGAREIDDAGVAVRGSLPDWLRGDLLLNGPALWDLPDGSYAHWFDGLAMLHRVRIAPGGASYRSRFLRSRDYLESLEAGHPAYGGFGSPEPQPWWQRLRQLRQPRVTDNGAVVMSRIDGRWVAQTETPLLTEFDPDTLETVGRFAFEDHEPLHLMSAHGITEADGTYWNVGAEFGPHCSYKVFRVRPGSRRREVLARIPVGKPGYLHAFALTPQHVLVWEPALRAHMFRFMFSGSPYMDKFAWEPEGGSRIHRISRADGRVQTWTVPPMMAFHAVQAWEDGDDTVLDLCTWGDGIFADLRLDRLRAGRPPASSLEVVRYRLAAGATAALPQRLAERVELPAVHGSRYSRSRARFAWGAGLDPAGQAPMFDRTVKLDLDGASVAGTWQRPEGAVQMEPLMVDRPGSGDEEDGVLLVPTLADGDAGTVLAVLDAASMQCLATLELPQVVPFGFHAAWNGPA
ncbi:carotenoid oxygenase family protein [Ramlibacter sp.]|uniref:carotenoid oxygenase family protein n=1 Tax=Ramlibacter sp. TaxID=1917967 RepID=UPI002D2AB267|nr:carotenoid oxygenase family protein [Ramlibacter sp.]HYD75368.1 carotenoid oxygenase family protein [Ramlibacter sp.]